LKRYQAFAMRLSLGVVDQILSSGSNFIATLVAARTLGATHFGSFSVILVSYLMALGFNRGLCGEAMLVRPGEGEDERRARGSRATASAVYVGLGASVIFVVVSSLTHGDLSRCALVMAFVMPGLLLQDTLRYAAFSRDEPKAALISDGFWTVGQFVAFGLLALEVAQPTPAVVVLCWALPGVGGGLLQMAIDRVVPRLRSGVEWIAANRDLSLRYALDFLSSQGAGQVATYALAGISGVTAVGTLRGAQTLFGPLNILLTGTYIVLVPEGRRAVQRSTRQLTVMCLTAALAFMTTAFVVLGLLLLLSHDQGAAILGPTWPAARTVLLPVALGNAAGGLYAGATTGLRAMSAAGSLLRVRLITMPTAILCPLVGAVLGDAKGMAYGIVVAELIAITWYAMAYRREIRAFVPSSDPLTPFVPVDDPDLYGV
jgi:O-antigen/teichoic acid export membrane protein